MQKKAPFKINSAFKIRTKNQLSIQLIHRINIYDSSIVSVFRKADTTLTESEYKILSRLNDFVIHQKRN